MDNLLVVVVGFVWFDLVGLQFNVELKWLHLKQLWFQQSRVNEPGEGEELRGVKANAAERTVGGKP